jgi:hypothetical protein
MQVSSLILLGRGNGYLAPMVTMVPRFKHMFPDADAAGQAAAFANILKSLFEKQLCCPVFAAAPVIT